MSVATNARSVLIERPRVPRRETVIGHVVGLALALAGAGMVASSIVEKLTGGSDAVTLLGSGLLVGIPGIATWNRTRPPERLSASAIFAAALSGWVVFSLAATIPYLASGTLVRFDLALFEAVSGFTTTAATVLQPVSSASHGLLFWRAITQWIGGISIVVFAVSVLPFLGVGGMELAQGTTAGLASEFLGPRVRTTARRLVPLYVAFTAIVGFGYVAFGMSAYDGVTHAFTTVSTGGFSTHDRSFASFGSSGVEWVAIIAMVVAGGSLALYWRALRGKPLVLARSAEFRAYLLVTGLFCTAAVVWNGSAHGFHADVVRRTIFTTVSLSTTTGYRMLDYNHWADAVQLVLIFAVALGGMAGSAAGGFKIFRLTLVLSYARRQLYSQLHPRAVTVIRFGRDVVPELVVTRVIGFFGLFMATGAAATFLVAAFGADVRTAISVVASAIGNVGPALGAVGPSGVFLDVHAGTRAVVMVLMLVGRLEIFPVLLGAVPLMRFVSDRLPGRGAQRFARVFRG